MKHTIVKMGEPLTVMDDNRKKTFINGYAFMDEHGSCIMIVYGENRRDTLSKYLNEDGDELGLKYLTIQL